GRGPVHPVVVGHSSSLSLTAQSGSLAPPRIQPDSVGRVSNHQPRRGCSQQTAYILVRSGISAKHAMRAAQKQITPPTDGRRRRIWNYICLLREWSSEQQLVPLH